MWKKMADTPLTREDAHDVLLRLAIYNASVFEASNLADFETEEYILL